MQRFNRQAYWALIKALVNEDILSRTHCCPWCFLGCANWETFVADTKWFWTKSETFFVSRTQNLCPQQMLHARANGETFVSATMCPQQCVLVCQGLNVVALNLNHIQLHLRRAYARPSTTFLCEQQVGSLKPIVNQARSPSWCWSGNHFCRRKSETAETSNFDEFKGKDCVFVADWLKTNSLHKLCSVFEGV